MVEGTRLLSARGGKTASEGSNPSLSATIYREMLAWPHRRAPRGITGRTSCPRIAVRALIA